MPDYRPSPPPPDDLAPVVDWPYFFDYLFDWPQDQHIAIIGPTDQGKSNLAFHLLQLRSYVAYLCIKSKDPTLDAFARAGGYHRTYAWPPQKKPKTVYKPYTWAQMPRRLVWPDASDRRLGPARQIEAFNACLDDCWSSGNATVVWDDFWYIARILGMAKDAKQNLLNARSNGSAQVIIAQRGAGNQMVELWDQPTWMFFARATKYSDLQGLGVASDPRRGFVQHLDRYQFLVENTRTGERFRTTAPLIESP